MCRPHCRDWSAYGKKMLWHRLLGKIAYIRQPSSFFTNPKLTKLFWIKIVQILRIRVLVIPINCGLSTDRISSCIFLDAI